MKKQISISIFLALFVIILAWFYIRVNNQLNSQNNPSTEEVSETEKSITISQEYITYQFYLKEEYGRLVVYESNTSSLFMETGIETHTLPMELQSQLEVGIFFKTEAELYDFLESYSS